jgi:hypothetical protein
MSRIPKLSEGEREVWTRGYQLCEKYHGAELMTPQEWIDFQKEVSQIVVGLPEEAELLAIQMGVFLLNYKEEEYKELRKKREQKPVQESMF